MIESAAFNRSFVACFFFLLLLLGSALIPVVELTQMNQRVFLKKVVKKSQHECFICGVKIVWSSSTVSNSMHLQFQNLTFF
ncbi:hypothetical protein QVD17_34318 [Tagetes erecta]|uniref:Secreted protein n=1 Tax=Tagetes erecta TaxID=13708 RepID=A0AAD8NL60_TARER|nr:hypothetical protein QVD17_34318 [Tagetes erecta]